jgi:DNA-binding XRE family transcriptional regulator
VKSNIQVVIEKRREFYSSLGKPLLQYLAELHDISIRDFAKVFGISNGHSEAILKHRVFPNFELAVRIARYFDCTTDDLFAWRVDDDGSRRPLLIVLPGKKGHFRLSHRDTRSGLPLVEQIVSDVEALAERVKRAK